MFFNLTNHTIRIVLEGERTIEIHPSGTVARLACTQRSAGEINGVPVVETIFGGPMGLPEPVSGVVYVTSTLVAQEAARRGRTDVYSPDTSQGSAVFNESGSLWGVCRLQTFRIA